MTRSTQSLRSANRFRGVSRTVAAVLLAAWLCGAAAADYETVVQAYSPVSWWRLGNESKMAVDQAGGVHGTFNNGVTIGEPGAVYNDADTSVKFDGLDDYIEVPHDDVHLLDNGTVMLWFWPEDTSGYQMLFSKDSSGYDTGGHLTVYLSGSTLYVRLQSATQDYEVSSSGVSSGGWNHVAFTWGAGGMALYLNGALVDQDGYTGGLGTTSGGKGNYEPAAIGASTWASDDEVVTPLNYYFDGWIDEVILFGAALTDTQIDDIYQAALPQYDSVLEGYKANAPIAWWRLDDAADSLVAEDEYNAHDGVYVGPTPGVAGVSMGVPNTAAEFDGVDDRVEIDALDVAGTEMTILAWFKADDFDFTDARIISKATGTATDDHYWMLGTWESSGETYLRARLRTDDVTTTLAASQGSFTTDEWVFAAMVFDGSSMIIYKDGAAVASVGKSGNLSTNAAVSTWIGDNPPGTGDKPFDGTIDEVAIFDTALSPQVIQAIYNVAEIGSSGIRVVEWVEVK